jgi:hypothetical protein
MENVVRVLRGTGEEIELPITSELLQAVQHLIAGAGCDEQGPSCDGTALNELTNAWMVIFRQLRRGNPDEQWDTNTTR